MTHSGVILVALRFWSLPQTFALLTTRYQMTMAGGATLLELTLTLLCLCSSRSLSTVPALFLSLTAGEPLCFFLAELRLSFYLHDTFIIFSQQIAVNCYKLRFIINFFFCSNNNTWPIDSLYFQTNKNSLLNMIAIESKSEVKRNKEKS